MDNKDVVSTLNDLIETCKDGEEGYPGTVEVRVWYVQAREEVDGAQQEVLYIEYEAELVGDEVEETAINMTNHR